MFGLKKRKNLIRVCFIDTETGEAFAESEMPSDQLPESFEACTRFEIKNEYWEVINAEPMTSAEFIESKKLKLVLQKIAIVKEVDPNTLLLSLPTISNELPPVKEGSSKLNKHIFEIREDDWRQYDILPLNVIDLINENLTAIKDIYDKSCVPIGGVTAFKNLHVRKGLDAPFENVQLKTSTLISSFQNATVYEGVSFAGIAGIIENSFSFHIQNGLDLYGLSQNDIIYSLSVFITDSEEAALKNLSNTLSKFDLCIVDWCRMKIYKENQEDSENESL